MKNFLKLIALVTLAAILCVSFVSCSLLNKVVPSNNSGDIPITFDKKYIKDNSESGSTNVISYTFYANQTGIMEQHTVYTSYTFSGTIAFEWRVAADGYVYLFQTGVRYNDDHTEGEKLYMLGALSFGDEFMTAADGQGQAYYILEGSDLEKAMKDE